ncbi:MAG: DUF4388 domain-containing protein, partial [Microthrixaceae bacterium]
MSGGIRYEETAVALQGTIDSFPLVDVLALLESSSKSGRLEVVGDRGRGILWVDGGQMVCAEVHGSTEVDAVDAVWELLRFNDGSFEFTVGHEPADTRYSADVGDTVDAAGRMLVEWERITERVPGLGHMVALSPDLPGEDVRLSADDWSVLVAAGPSRSVRDVLAEMGASEFAGCAKLAELVDRSLVVLGEPPAGAAANGQAAQPESNAPEVADAAEVADAPEQANPGFSDEAAAGPATEAAGHESGAAVPDRDVRSPAADTASVAEPLDVDDVPVSQRFGENLAQSEPAAEAPSQSPA